MSRAHRPTVAPGTRSVVAESRSAPPPSANARFWAWAAVALVLVLVAAIRVRLLDVPLERDEGEYAYAGQLILRGIPPYQMAYNMKLPGAYAVYALFLALFGPTARGVHLGLLVVNAAAVVLLFQLVRRLFGSFAGVCAAATYALLSVGQPVRGIFAHSSHLVVLFALAGFLRLLIAAGSGRRRDYLGSGLLFGLSFVMKQHGIFFVVFGAAAVLLPTRGHGRGGRRPWTSAPGAAFALGAAAPFLLACLVLLIAGVFPAFWFWTFRYASAYASELPLAEGLANLRNAIVGAVPPAAPLWGLGLAGLAALLADRTWRSRRALVVLFALTSFITMCPGLYFREHYWILFLPALALLAGLAVEWLRQRLLRSRLRRAAGPIAAAVFLGLFVATLVGQRQFLFQATAREASRWTYGPNPFVEAPEVARYIAAHSAPGERILVMGSEPEIYFYANRASATGHIYMYGLMEHQPYALTMQQQAVREIEQNAPAWIVFVNCPQSWLIRPDSERWLLQWYARYVEERYQPAGLVEIISTRETAYRWSPSVTIRDTRSPYFLMVYRRKPAT